MTTLLPSACRRTVAFGILVAAFVLAGAGCKPSPPPSTGQATPSADSSTARQPTADDFRAFFQSLLPATIKVSEIKADAPVRMPNTAPANNAWLLTVKLTLTPAEDLLSLPSTQDTQPIDNLVSELNALTGWRNTYVNTPYAKACGGLEIKVPASPMPQLLIVTQAMGRPLAPIYGKVSAEWQVDHWQFVNVNMTLPKCGEPRASFTDGPTMVKGSPEAEQAVGAVRDAVAQARKNIEAIRSRYAEQVAKGTKPGTVYQGRISFRQDALPCELHFVDPPTGGDTHFASIEVRLPSVTPPCLFSYNAKVTTDLPIPVPGPQPTPTNINPTFDFDDSHRVPNYNVSPKLVRSSGKLDARTLPATIRDAGRFDLGGGSLLLLDGHLEGKLSEYFEGILLSVQETK